MFLADGATTPRSNGMSYYSAFAARVQFYRNMSMENMPGIDVPYVAVIATRAGASPEDIEKDIAKHIEDGVSGVEVEARIIHVPEDMGVMAI